jgi:hypothetical protein
MVVGRHIVTQNLFTFLNTAFSNFRTDKLSLHTFKTSRLKNWGSKKQKSLTKGSRKKA